jgi:hypothetical protein
MKKGKVIKVTGCKDCPFFVDKFDTGWPDYCYFTRESLEEHQLELVPTNCPLKEGKVVVEIKS